MGKGKRGEERGGEKGREKSSPNVRDALTPLMAAVRAGYIVAVVRTAISHNFLRLLSILRLAFGQLVWQKHEQQKMW